MTTDSPLELETWTVPSDRRDRNWGEGVVIRRRDGPRVFFRFYEFNLFGAVREGPFTKGDKELPHTATADGSEASITYPDHGVTIELEAAETGVDLSLTVENRTGRDWPDLATLDPCLNPGRDETNAPLVPELFDEEQRHTYYYGSSGLATLDGRTLHVHEDYYDAVADAREEFPPSEDLPWTWCDAADTSTKPLLVRESPDGTVSTGIAWEDALGAQGHNPWNCMHLMVKVGPVPAGERSQVRGKIYLEHGGRDRIVDRYRAEFEE